MDRTQHPVWTVYDELRTARLNVKYYSRRLCSVERANLGLEIVLSVAAPSSAIAGLGFWETVPGQILWKLFAVIAALAAVLKPLLNLSKRIKKYQSVLSGYRALEVDLLEIKSLIEQKRKYDDFLQTNFHKSLQKKKALVNKTPESRENKKVKIECEKEVNREPPPEHFFVPEE
jgi:hypothetical protein